MSTERLIGRHRRRDYSAGEDELGPYIDSSVYELVDDPDPDPPDPDLPSGDVIDVSHGTGRVVLEEPGVYDFGGADHAADRDVYIGTDVVARNLRGPGSRLILRGAHNARFEHFDWDYCQIEGTTGGHTVDPRWTNGRYLGDLTRGSTISRFRCIALRDQPVIRPLWDNVDLFGHPLVSPSARDHVDALICSNWDSDPTSPILDPTFRRCGIITGGSLGILLRFTAGTITFEHCQTITKRPTAANDVMVDANDIPNQTLRVLMRGNDFDTPIFTYGNGSDVEMVNGSDMSATERISGYGRFLAA